MPVALPEPPADRGPAWRSPPPPPNPDEALARRGRRVSADLLPLVLALAAVSVVALMFLAASDGPLATLAEAAIPVVVLGVIGAVVLWGAASVIGEWRQPAQERRARELIGAWARERGLSFEEAGDLPEATPLLTKGTTRRAHNIVSGELPGGLPGVLANYVYIVRREDEGDLVCPHTVVVARVPETLGFLSELVLAPRARGIRNRLVDRTVGALSRSLRRRRRIRLESAKLERRFAVSVPEGEDESWVRQLFRPSFVDWLAEHSPADLLFELRGGVVCVGVAREVTDPAYLEGLCRVACYVAGRFREEALEVAGVPGATLPGPEPVPAPLASPPVQGVGDAALPADVATAARPLRGTAARDPRTWLWPLAFGAIGLVAGLVVVGLITSPEETTEENWVPEGGALLAGLALGAVIGGFWFAREARKRIRARALAYGKEAFLRAYARARGLAFEPPRAFHARYVNASLPGPARLVVSGPLAGAAVQGSLVIGTHGERSGGEYVAVVAPFGDGRGPTVRLRPGAEAPASAAKSLPAELLASLREGEGSPLGLGLEGGTMVLYQDTYSDSLSARNLDAFGARACSVVEAAGTPARTPA